MSELSKKPYELPLEAYRLLVGLVTSEEQLLWSRNQAFIVINGAMITALSLIRPTSSSTTVPMIANTPKQLYLAISAVGFLTCLLWLATIIRSEAIYNHFIEQLKFLEKEYLHPIRTFQLADDFFAKGEITLGSEKFTLSRAARIIRIYQALKVASLGFLIIWVTLGFYLTIQ